MTSASNEDNYITDVDFRGIGEWLFDARLREEVRKANGNIQGEGQAPWEVVMEALIALKHDMENR